MAANEKLHYIEFSSKNLAASKRFFSQVFGWVFTDFGDDYSAFGAEAGLEGGFYAGEKANLSAQGGALMVFYSDNLELSKQTVIAGGAQVIRDIFSFPGGRRFHFVEPGGNELAVWSDTPSAQGKNTQSQ